MGLNTPWSRVVNSTIKNYIKGAEVLTLRNRKLLALLKKKGRITFNWSGTSVVWRVKYRRFKPTPWADGDTQSFTRKDRYKTAELDWRGYAMNDNMTKGEYLQNRGKEAIINLYSQIAEDLMEDMTEAFSEELYIDGTLPQNERRIHGIESFLQATANAGNGAATPTGTFGGLSCVPGAYGGAWDPGSYPGWPNGRGDTAYDFWTPLCVDVGDDTFFGAPSAGVGSWTANCVEIVSFAIVKGKKSKSDKGQLDLFLFDDEMYRIYLKTLRTKERIEVSRDATKSPLVALGFSDVVNQDGTDLTWEYGIPPQVGYGFNCDMMEIRSQQDQLFVPEGPEQSMVDKSWRFAIDFFGNATWVPKFQTKIANFTNASASL